MTPHVANGNSFILSAFALLADFVEQFEESLEIDSQLQ